MGVKQYQSSSTYVLENYDESNRLENQATCTYYKPSVDYPHELLIKPFSKILDAGCGSGVVSRYLRDTYPATHIDGCDFSSNRILQAKEFAKKSPYNKINFFVSDLENIDVPNNIYDFVTCRYVFHHLENPQKVCDEFYRITKPGGRVYLVDFDGLVLNFYSNNFELMSLLNKLQENWPTDIFIGRKLSSLLKNSGFNIQSIDAKIITFKNQTLDEEISLMKGRFKTLMPAITKVLSSATKAEQFCNLYLYEMSNPTSILFYNKFLVTVIKPMA